ncbi:hypothetical protein AC1031_006595 [Aphanomyces cochlioides]|nr:hypothetical protein AC1031_006595 [Aphanomyces cochlioides]
MKCGGVAVPMRLTLPKLQYTQSEQVMMDTMARDKTKRISGTVLAPMDETKSTHEEEVPVSAAATSSNRVLPVETIHVSNNGSFGHAPDSTGKNPSSNAVLRFLSKTCTAPLYHASSYMIVVLQTYRENIDIYHEYNDKFHWMIHPNSTFRRVWDVVVAMLVIYVCIMTPVALSFDFLDWSVLEPVDSTLDVCFILDMVLSFRTGVYAYGEVRMESMYVAKHYLKGWFVIDLMSNFPFQLFLSSFSGSIKQQKFYVKFVKLQKLPKLLRFGILLKYMRQYAKYYVLLLTTSAMILSLHGFA